MYKDVLRSIADVELFPILGFLLFMGVFIIITIHAIKLTKQEVKTLESLPFDFSESEEVQS